MAKPPMFFQSIGELAEQIRSGTLSPIVLTQTLLGRIGSLNSKLHAYKIVLHEQALAQAEAAEKAIRSGNYLGPLHGIPYAAKDLFDVRGLPTEAGCSLLENNISAEDATVIRRLREAGAVLIGKTHTVQFAFGGVGINHDQGTPHNPWHIVPHAPGGSSSGTGVAVSSGMAPMGLGSDTGGSVRIPASLCGITGLKTTVGRISRKGVYPLSWSLDSVGPLARSVEDCALAYQAMQGTDGEGDETTVGQTPHDVLRGMKRGVKNLRIFFAETVFWDDAHPEVIEAVRACGEVFRSQGALVESREFSEAQEAQMLNPRGLVIAAEGYAVNRKWVEDHEEQLDPVVGARLASGRNVKAFEYFEITRKWAALRRKTGHTLADVDALIVPSTAIPSLPLEEIDHDLQSYTHYNLLYLRNTAIGNILNLCAVSIPCGQTKKGLPIGLMIYAKPFQEEMALRIAYAFEQASPLVPRQPSLDWLS